MKLSSSIWNRVILPSETVRIIAKGDSMTFPVAFTLEASSPIMTARSSSAKTPWTSKHVLDHAACVANEVGGRAAPGLTSDPRQHANVARNFKLDISTKQCSNLVRICPAPIPARSCRATQAVLFWLTLFSWA